jgi:hypothetical protein
MAAGHDAVSHHRAIVVDGFGFTQHLPTDYDVLIFFDQTNPSALLPLN